jgi:predicted nucleotidyltransferase
MVLKETNMEKILFITNVGSHMWRMETPSSDLDLMVVYQESTRDILEGRLIHKTKPDKTFERDGVLIDQKEQEIGHLVNKLIDGNVNAIWTVCTPLIMQDHHYLRELCMITKQNLSKASYASIKGMATSQFKDHTKRAGVMPEGKALKTAWRTCEFGQMLLLAKEIKFKPAPVEEVTVSDVEWILNALDYTYNESPLPERPDEKPFRDFLFDIRIDELTRRE